MRIGLNLLYLIPGIVGGTETYAKGLLSGLKSINPDYEFILFLNQESKDLLPDEQSDFKKVVCPVHARNRRKRYAFEQFSLRKYIKNYNIDLLHSLAYSSPIFLLCPSIVTVPDLNFMAFGKSMPFVRYLALRFMVSQSVLQSDKVITLSKFSRQEILRRYSVSPEKVVVSYLAASSIDISTGKDAKGHRISQLSDLRSSYAVAFSAATANKNLARLIEAFLRAKRSSNIEQNLVIIGHKHETAVNLRPDDQKQVVYWAGYLDKADVDKVMQQADFMVFPSFYEGFGLPVLEAMAAGVPVVCSKAASLPEVAGDAALYFDPFSVQDMAEKITWIAKDRNLRKTLREKGFDNLERFSWRKTAIDTLAVYNGILKQASVDHCAWI